MILYICQKLHVGDYDLFALLKLHEIKLVTYITVLYYEHKDFFFSGYSTQKNHKILLRFEWNTTIEIEFGMCMLMEFKKKKCQCTSCGVYVQYAFGEYLKRS